MVVIYSLTVWIPSMDLICLEDDIAFIPLNVHFFHWIRRSVLEISGHRAQSWMVSNTRLCRTANLMSVSDTCRTVYFIGVAMGLSISLYVVCFSFVPVSSTVTIVPGVVSCDASMCYFFVYWILWSQLTLKYGVMYGESRRVRYSCAIVLMPMICLTCPSPDWHVRPSAIHFFHCCAWVWSGLSSIYLVITGHISLSIALMSASLL